MTPLRHKRFLLFDLDGTLLDSNQAHAEAFSAALAAENIVLPVDYGALRGLDTPSAFRRLGVADPELVQRLTASKRAMYRRRLGDGAARLHAGAAELLDGLVASGRVCVLVTSASRASTEQALLHTGITQRFRAIVAADDVRAAKPAPEPFLRAMSLVGAEPSACLTIEDSPDGALASARAGVDVVLVHRPPGSADVPCFATLGDLGAHLELPATRQGS
jgi:HAD superfamily hydrolase (TIGR01509 family)